MNETKTASIHVYRYFLYIECGFLGISLDYIAKVVNVLKAWYTDYLVKRACRISQTYQAAKIK